MKFFVVESDWEELSEEAYSNGRRKSILPFLEFIKTINPSFGFAFKTANTEQELRYCLRKFFDMKQLEEKYILVFSGHGKQGTFIIGTGEEEKELTLEKLSEICASIDKNIFKNTVVHFDSCSVFRASVKKLNDFKDKTNAETLMGFSKKVEFVDSCALELMLFEDLLTSNKDIFTTLQRFYDNNEELCEKNQFNWMKDYK